ncbi:MAG: hypothetical protein CSB02_00420 [Bacteroidia bacterium]|nr:MAG: hypothetical protein CSB02_00420 [Bacteroidia bacterium]
MKKLILSVVVLFLGVVSLQAQNNTTPVKNPNAPVITFEKTTHDYGTIYERSHGNVNFVYTNTGKEPLILNRVKSSCGCTIPKWSRQPLMPGESDTIKVHYDTKRIGSFHKSITITSNATTPNVVLKIKGKVIREESTALPTKNVAKGASPMNK